MAAFKVQKRIECPDKGQKQNQQGAKPDWTGRLKAKQRTREFIYIKLNVCVPWPTGQHVHGLVLRSMWTRILSDPGLLRLEVHDPETNDNWFHQMERSFVNGHGCHPYGYRHNS